MCVYMPDTEEDTRHKEFGKSSLSYYDTITAIYSIERTEIN